MAICASESPPALFKYFNSFNIFLPSSDLIYDLKDRLISYWIPEYLKWYKSMAAASVHERLPSGFPVLNVKGSNILQYIDSVEELLTYGQDIGFALSISLLDYDCKTNKTAFSKLCSKQIIKYLHVSIAVDTDDNFILELVEWSHIYNFYLTLILPVKKINSRVFTTESLGGQNIQIEFTDSKSSTLHIIDRELYSASCVPYFVISIDEDGYIFPCQGLVGISNASLGSIYDDFSDTAFMNKHNISLNLNALALYGIGSYEDDSNIPKEIRIDNKLPPMCNIHRDILNDS